MAEIPDVDVARIAFCSCILTIYLSFIDAAL